jgi:hypothetical protein
MSRGTVLEQVSTGLDKARRHRPSTGAEDEARTIALWLGLIAAAAAGVALQQVIKRDAKALGLSRLELRIVVAVASAVASRMIVHALRSAGEPAPTD